MTDEPETVVLSKRERLRKSRRQGTSMSLPLAVHHRLDLLAELAADVDASRAEIVAMLICNAPFDSEALETAVLAYRKLTVGDVLPQKKQPPEEPQLQNADNVVSITKRGPGRPARSDAG